MCAVIRYILHVCSAPASARHKTKAVDTHSSLTRGQWCSRAREHLSERFPFCSRLFGLTLGKSQCCFSLLLQQQQRLSGALAQTAGLSNSVRKQVGWWLAGCSGWVFSMVVLGGMTRLTRSGLSMTDWKFTGERPPQSLVHRCSTSDVCAMQELMCTSTVKAVCAKAMHALQAEWQVEFEKYKQSPEYRKVNRYLSDTTQFSVARLHATRLATTKVIDQHKLHSML